ncbi:MAG: radical SAM protein [Anaerolineae bacterium]|nr:radical SAM protein [Anaerolineae bacterium]
MDGNTIVFGPVPSRRLGRSLGVNNIPPKHCTYSCVYCQIGRTTQMRVERSAFYEPERVLAAVQTRIAQADQAGERIDYLTFVPDGEPTLDIHLGRTIVMLKSLGLPVAVITNGALLWQEDVRTALMQADWVSCKVDAVQEAIWRRIDRPHRRLRLSSILDGMLAFASTYGGALVTETMLVGGINDADAHLRQVADFVGRLQPDAAFLSIPTRPPAVKWVRPVDEAGLNRAYQILCGRVAHVECLIGYEGNAFASTGDAVQDLLSITAVHPMREDAVGALLARTETDWSVVDGLIAQGHMRRIDYEGKAFYARKLDAKQNT